jgi:hypothetical protein
MRYSRAADAKNGHWSDQIAKAQIRGAKYGLWGLPAASLVRPDGAIVNRIDGVTVALLAQL